MQHTHHLNPLSVDTINDAVRVSANHFVAGTFAYALGPDQWIESKAVRSGLDGSDNAIGGYEAELCVVRFDGGDIPYRPAAQAMSGTGW